jgi:hypothetical protein
MIAQRTKEALAVSRKRLAREGRRLGNPNGARALRKARKGNSAAVSEIIAKADRKAADLRDVLVDIEASGARSLAGYRGGAERERDRVSPRGPVVSGERGEVERTAGVARMWACTFEWGSVLFDHNCFRLSLKRPAHRHEPPRWCSR